jgi:RNA polymerase sigma-70 factor (ECF subfamily)
MLARASKRRAAHEVAVEDGALLEHAALADDPELLLVRERCRDAVQAALHAAVAALDDRERTLMRLTLRDGLTVDQLGALFQVHRATAARWLAAVRAKLRATVRERLVTTLNLGTGEVDSFIQAIGSRIDLSLAGQFEHTTPT